MSLNLIDPPQLTLQGEGPYSGWPTVFLRMTGCTVGCKFCDEARTWKKRAGSITENDLHNWLRENILSRDLFANIKVSITGGEPLEDPDGLRKLISIVRSAGIMHHSIGIETSGCFPPLAGQLEVGYVLSPKLHDKRLLSYEEFKRQAVYSHVTIKFVTTENHTAEAIASYVKDRTKLFYLQPCYTNAPKGKGSFDSVRFLDTYWKLVHKGFRPLAALQIHKALEVY